jgi:hypothetical protein
VRVIRTLIVVVAGVVAVCAVVALAHIGDGSEVAPARTAPQALVVERATVPRSAGAAVVYSSAGSTTFGP